MVKIRESGFSLVTTLTLGLITTSAVMVTLAQGAKQKTNVRSTETHFQSMAVAEGNYDLKDWVSNIDKLECDSNIKSKQDLENIVDQFSNQGISYKDRIITSRGVSNGSTWM